MEMATLDDSMIVQNAIEGAYRHARRFLDGLGQRPVHATASIEDLRRELGGALDEDGRPAERVIDDLVAAVEPGLLASAGGRFFGWVIGGGLPAAVAADWLTAVWDQNAAAPACSPAAAVVEEISGDWLRTLLRLPSDASFGLVTGCQAAHVTALAAARHSLLARRGWDAERRGLFGAPPIRLMVSEGRHESLIRAARLLGLGTDAIETIACDGIGRIDHSALTAALTEPDDRPVLLCLQAGDLHTGAFDRFGPAIDAARTAGAWVHVDGAFGLWAAASRRFRHLLDGAAAADSWATDGHKWLNLPFDCGFVFVADPAAHSAALTQPTPYAIPVDAVRNPMDFNPEWSRRARGFAVYAALRSLGCRGVEALVDRCCDHARTLVAGLGSVPGAEVLVAPIINQGLVRFRADEADDSGHCDAFTDRVIDRLHSDGRAWFGGTTWRGRRAMRVSVCNWRTTDSDVATAVQAVSDAIATARADMDTGR